MPSAAIDKSDKTSTSTDIVVSDTAIAPIKQAITVIDHKIRNLQKRKSKLTLYKEIGEKELNSDQKSALENLNGVLQTLDFALEIQKQFQSIVSACEKEAKKQAKREAAEKTRAELAKIREVLLVQDALNQMGLDEVREDFLQGRNGATQLTEAELKLLDDVYPIVTPKREGDDPNVFNESVHVAADNLLSIIEAKPKQVFDGTFSQVKEILGKIHGSQYFQQGQVTSVEQVVITKEAPVEQTPPTVTLNQTDNITEVSQEGTLETITIEATNYQAVVRTTSPEVAVSVAPVDPTNVVSSPSAQQQQMPIATAVSCVIDPSLTAMQAPQQEIFYQQASLAPIAQHQQQQQQLHQSHRAIAEILGGTGNFFFLQESEIDTPEQIPTQTFTNQTFVVQPPPPIPLPPQFQPTPSPQISTAAPAPAAPIANNMPQQLNNMEHVVPAGTVMIPVVSIKDSENLTAAATPVNITAGHLHAANNIIDKRRVAHPPMVPQQQQVTKANSNQVYCNNNNNGFNNNNNNNKYNRHQQHGGRNNNGQNRSQSNRH